MTHLSTQQRLRALEIANVTLRQEKDELERLLLETKMERDHLKTRVITLTELEQ